MKAVLPFDQKALQDRAGVVRAMAREISIHDSVPEALEAARRAIL